MFHFIFNYKVVYNHNMKKCFSINSFFITDIQVVKNL